MRQEETGNRVRGTGPEAARPGEPLKPFGFYPEGSGDPLQGFKQKGDRIPLPAGLRLDCRGQEGKQGEQRGGNIHIREATAPAGAVAGRL